MAATLAAQQAENTRQQEETAKAKAAQQADEWLRQQAATKALAAQHAEEVRFQEKIANEAAAKLAKEFLRQQDAAQAQAQLLTASKWGAILLAGAGLAWFILRYCWRAIRQIRERNKEGKITMQQKQNYVLWIGVALVVLLLIFPPWKFSSKAFGAQSETPGPYALIFNPPKGAGTVQVDMTRLAIPVGVVILITGAVLFTLRNNKNDKPKQ